MLLTETGRGCNVRLKWVSETGGSLCSAAKRRQHVAVGGSPRMNRVNENKPRERRQNPLHSFIAINLDQPPVAAFAAAPGLSHCSVGCRPRLYR